MGLNVELFILYYIKNTSHVTFIYRIANRFFNRDGPIVLMSSIGAKTKQIIVKDNLQVVWTVEGPMLDPHQRKESN